MCLYLYTPADSAAKIRAMCLTPHNNNTNSGAKRQNSHYYWRLLGTRRESRHMAVTAGDGVTQTSLHNETRQRSEKAMIKCKHKEITPPDHFDICLIFLSRSKNLI